ncbi:GIY-YIG nuclease family protein [Massilia orientalis]|uniref:GIY-YIG nuclease family protein n=1 Tax=Massilia orientalis TaxID=3050128 RepID=A0ACC7M6S2_9BURK|nr:GIY-YIG nuclease family protein [Massilia sp. YIM B02787]
MTIELDGGWIYVIMTSSDYNRYKIGRTNGNPMDRVKKLRTGDPGVDLQAAYFIPASHGKLSQVEAALHREFEPRISFHDETVSEWFRGDAKRACEWMEYLLGEWKGQPVTFGLYLLGEGRICRAFEDDLRSIYGPFTPASPIDGLPW